jgi:hypothetical protein
MDMKIKQIYCVMLSRYPFPTRPKLALEILSGEFDFPALDLALELRTFMQATK